ncbi:response regulator [Microseira wollei]|uniref:Response regulator n=1 Tax=Microseira wollei NIES-4236 TaxID=2530354 RepID=A0AAV3X843_9CYAN|nr:response regulator [Microseira wollei]GET38328.1 response regulator [Microseira wollei NIES-4236]
MSKFAILCVDDEAIILNSVIRQLQDEFEEKYTYEAAESAEEALEVLAELEEEEIQTIVIVSDWLMPGMKGDEFLVEVHKRFPKVVKILLTGQADEAAIERANKHADLHRYIAKPWEKKDLIAAIITGLEKL